jgi:uncharacterized protein (TIGR03118 family)
MPNILTGRRLLIIAILTVLLGIDACKQNETTSPDSTFPLKANHNANSAYVATYLVADTAGYGAARIDMNLRNAWGISIGSTGIFWLSANGTGLSTVYDLHGDQVRVPVTIPSRTTETGGAPTGNIFNPTSDFKLPSGAASRFIFAGEDGIIAAWGGGGAAVRVAMSTTDQAVYKGIAMASTGGNNYLYVTNFREAKIDVYDKNFALVTTMPFTDPAMPAGYGPFGIANIGGKLFVTYALQKAPENKDDDAGPGHGFVDVYNADGTFVMRFASQGTLNSPWGIAMSRPGFGRYMNSILIGNFGDGTISAFDDGGNYLGQLGDKDGNALVIDGLWGIMFTDPSGAPDTDPNRLYFTAGPDGEEHGTFGYIQHK